MLLAQAGRAMLVPRRFGLHANVDVDYRRIVMIVMIVMIVVSIRRESGARRCANTSTNYRAFVTAEFMSNDRADGTTDPAADSGLNLVSTQGRASPEYHYDTEQDYYLVHRPTSV
jgi:hypothetical protein